MRTRAIVWAVLLLTVSASVVDAQRGRGRRGEGWYGGNDVTEFNVPYNGRFVFTRLQYDAGSPWDLRWDHDYPRAERHLATILEELTTISTHLGGSNIIPIGDPDLFRYPVAYLSEPGFWRMSEDQAENMRNYLLKGGFLIVDDFAGDGQWFGFVTAIRQVLPEGRLVELDAAHPIFDSFYHIETLNHYHPYYGLKSSFYGIFEDNDPDKRLLVVANYNNDIGESWEWSDVGFIPIDLTNEAYKLGVNYIVYSMTH